MKKILISMFFLVFSNTIESQINYFHFAKNIFYKNLSPFDFVDSTSSLILDTFNIVGNPAEIKEYNDPTLLIEDLYKIMDIVNKEEFFYDYEEFINDSFFQRPLHVRFYVNSKTNTFCVNVWVSKEDISKIESVSILKHETKFAPLR